eukprot:NODE_5656_length_987_cov_32.951389_g5079_i0.p1 GENE.NODE_5656_length_987_cov_32.951389_g5079_i0~~NODE_5656_length_987_cov_32.951389_g5079_i0.p1  ORF type:complete len:307 (-),score=59.56 NODE_5656_length_987_cov_32.951389_g5079_i0:65-928(-)
MDETSDEEPADEQQTIILNEIEQKFIQLIEQLKANISNLPTDIHEEATERINYIEGIFNARNQFIEMNDIYAHARILQSHMEKCLEWPRNPIDIKVDVEKFYYNHPSEGRIKMQWSNPLPIPGFSSMGYSCDGCHKQGVQVAYQHVDEEGRRDSSTFHSDTWGWDLCPPCAEIYIKEENKRIYNCIKENLAKSLAAPNVLVRPHMSSNISLDLMSILTRNNLIEISLLAPADGEIFLCVACDNPEMPNWLSSDVQTIIQSTADLDPNEICILPIISDFGHFLMLWLW